MDKYRIRQEYGDQPTNELEALEHTLAVYADEPDARWVLTATRNMYDEGVTTGLTLGDLRKIARKLKI